MNFDSKKETVISIVAYNAVESIKKCLNSLAWTANRDDIQVVIYDNSSNKDIEAYTINKRFEYHTAIQNLGFGKAHNKIFDITKDRFNHKYTLLLNPDTELGESEFTALLEILTNSEEIAIIAPKLIDQDGGQEKSVFTDPSGLAYFFDFTKQLFTRYSEIKSSLGLVAPNESAYVKGVTGACMLIKNKAVISNGIIFDPDFFMYYEDLDLCKRIRSNGCKIYFYEKIALLHRRGKSSDDFNNKNRWLLEMMYKSLSIYFKNNKSILDQTILRFSIMSALYLRIAFKKDIKWAERMIKEISSI